MNPIQITQYIRRERRSFKELPLHLIDLLIFAQIVYWDYSDIPEQKKIFAVKDVFHTDMEKLARKTFYPDKNIHLFRVLYANPRYRNIPIIHRAERFSSQREEQFAAIVIIPCPNTAVISFQGTDSSLLGWKENFNMACRCPVPAQLDAKNFLEQMLSKLKEEKIYLVGHSKGGNLAEYAAITIDNHLGRRITKVLDFDGPGFREDFIQANKDKEILKRIKKYSPASSIVGSIMKSFVPIRPIQSSQYFMLQHDPFTWLIYQQGFLRATELSRFTKFFHESHINWLNDISDTDRQIFVDASYKMISALDAQTVAELQTDRIRKLKELYEEFQTLEPALRDKLLFMFADFLRSLKDDFISNRKEDVKSVLQDFKNHLPNITRMH